MKSILYEDNQPVKNNNAANKSLDVRAKQLLFKILRVKLGVARIRFCPTSIQSLGVFSILEFCRSEASMNLPENQKAEISASAEDCGNLVLHQSLITKINRLMELTSNDPDRLTITFCEEEKAKLKDQYAQHMDDYRFYLDFGLKANGVFYAVLGTILSLYFGNNPNLDRGLVIFFLLVPIVIGFILGVVFLVGARLWGQVSKKFYAIAEVLETVIVHQVGILTWLLRIFGTLFLGIGVALILLMIYLI